MVPQPQKENGRQVEFAFDNLPACSYKPGQTAKWRIQNELETRYLNMKKIIASVGMVALGSTGLHAANYGDLTPDETSKRWSVSAAVRGFYDDNYATRPSGPDKRDSFGFEISPSASLNYEPTATSFLGLKYIYTLSFYEDRPTHKIDQTHDVRLNLDHRFNERNHINLTDQFVYSIEPTLLDQGGTVTAPLRSDAEGLHNRARCPDNRSNCFRNPAEATRAVSTECQTRARPGCEVLRRRNEAAR